MVDDQIKLVIADLIKARDEIKELKRDKKNLEKNIPEALLNLQKAKKDLVAQIKDLEEQHQADLNTDDTYGSIRESIVEKEEELAEKIEKLFQLINQIPQERAINMDVPVGEALVKLQTERALHVYLNGREEKMGKK